MKLLPVRVTMHGPLDQLGVACDAIDARYRVLWAGAPKACTRHNNCYRLRLFVRSLHRRNAS